MANKFKNLEPLPPGEDSVRPVFMGMDGGFRGDISPRLLKPGESPSLDDVRFERGAVRKDFGWQSVGTAAPSTILGLIEHKFIDGQLTFHRLIRVTRNIGGFAVLDAWDGANWVVTDTSLVTINDVYLSMVSALGALYIAEGSQILEWGEELEKTDQEDDFLDSNKLENRGETTVATVSPASADILDYAINYDVIVNSSPTQDTDIIVEFLHLATILGEKAFFVARTETFPFSFMNEEFEFTRLVDDGDEVTIRVKSAEGGGISTEIDPIQTAGGGGEPDIVGDKTPALQPAINDQYEFNIFVSNDAVDNCTATVGIYTDIGAGFVLKATVEIQLVGPSGSRDLTLTLPGLTVANTRFGLNMESVTGAGCILGDTFFSVGINSVTWIRTNADFEIHGHNKTTQFDDPAGVTYQTTGAAITTFTPIDPGPGARYLFYFARRLIALHDSGDSQIFAFSVDGILDDFDGVGSGSLPLVSSRSDAIDALQGGAVLSSNFMAVFRKRSIMRAFETGNVKIAIGVVDWIEDLGTNCPFSIRNVRGGVIFLGHDDMVYFLTEQGPREIGLPIHQDLIENLTGDLSLVDSGYDPTFAEYYLGYPVGAAATITRVWIFDVDKFLRDGSLIWRRKPMAIARFASAGISEVE
ncbi:hypothetical protein LCGC14_0251500 [marine sediment metagenome]|uniref:Uncharacterized protein n=1 Tax=marine sediment metagenome TaxID=412755 RepID=A0A0F9X8Y6_9ZZZZ